MEELHGGVTGVTWTVIVRGEALFSQELHGRS